MPQDFVSPALWGKKFPSPTLYLTRGPFVQMKRIRTKALQNRNSMWNHNQEFWAHSLSIVILALDRLCDCCRCYTSWPRTGWWSHFFTNNGWKMKPTPAFIVFWNAIHEKFIPYMVDPEKHSPETQIPHARTIVLPPGSRHASCRQEMDCETGLCQAKSNCPVISLGDVLANIGRFELIANQEGWAVQSAIFLGWKSAVMFNETLGTIYDTKRCPV